MSLSQACVLVQLPAELQDIAEAFSEFFWVRTLPVNLATIDAFLKNRNIKEYILRDRILYLNLI